MLKVRFLLSLIRPAHSYLCSHQWCLCRRSVVGKVLNSRFRLNRAGPSQW